MACPPVVSFDLNGYGALARRPERARLAVGGPARVEGWWSLTRALLLLLAFRGVEPPSSRFATSEPIQGPSPSFVRLVGRATRDASLDTAFKLPAAEPVWGGSTPIYSLRDMC